MPGFFIHLDDPGYYGGRVAAAAGVEDRSPEFPFGRRLGPYPRKKDALEQAASDAALGLGVPLGVWHERESEKLRHGDVEVVEVDGEPTERPIDAPPVYTRDEILARAAELREEAEARRLADAQARDEDLAAQWQAVLSAEKDPERLAQLVELHRRAMR